MGKNLQWGKRGESGDCRMRVELGVDMIVWRRGNVWVGRVELAGDALAFDYTGEHDTEEGVESALLGYIGATPLP